MVDSRPLCSGAGGISLDRAHKLEARLSRLSRKNPDKVSGRPMYFKDLSLKLNEKRAAATPERRKRMQQAVMKLHKKLHSQVKKETRLAYAWCARAQAAEKREKIAEQRKILVAELVEARKTVEQESQHRPPLILSKAHWAASDLETLREVAYDPALTTTVVSRRRDSACSAPQPMSASLIGALDDEEIPEQPKRPSNHHCTM